MTWDGVRYEILEASQENAPAFDSVRRSKIAAAEAVSGIPLIIYATDFTDESRASQYGSGLLIELEDKTGFLQAMSDLPANGPLDVLLHSPGGSPSATESIVRLLRSRFTPIRFIVPHTAKSAATMLALSGNEILLGEAAELGPIDPQFGSIPAGAAIDQFNRIHSDVTANPDRMRGWLPILQQYGPSFLQQCWNAVELSENLATAWLQDYMFAGEPESRERAERVATYLANHNNFMTHSRPVWMEQLLAVEPTLKIKSLRQIDPQFESAIMDVYWAINITFQSTLAFKLIEHQAESAYIRLMQPPTLPAIPIPVPVSPPSQPAPPNRAERRRQQRNRR